jgi:gliding motility-associated lipoprotein GldH
MLIFGFFLLCTISCKHEIILDDVKELNNGIWQKGNEVAFTFEAKDTITYYDFLLNVVTNYDYPYQNVYVNISTTFPDGKKTSQLMSLELSKADGTSLGKCSGGECEIPIFINEHIKFKNTGQYIISFSQKSREDKIDGIKSIALKIVQSKE